MKVWLLVFALFGAFAERVVAQEKAKVVTEDELNEIKLPKGHKGKYKILRVPLHYQQTAVWCWAASISMVNEFYYHVPIDDCEVTSKVDLKTGGEGKCCNYDTGTVDKRCYKGAKAKEITEVSEFYFHMHITEIHRPLTWDELTAELDAGHPPIAGVITGPKWSHAIVMFGYAAPNFIFIHDPTLGPIWTTYDALRGVRRRGPWYVTWATKPTDRTVFGTSDLPPALAKAPADSSAADVTFDVPTLSEAPLKKKVFARITKESGSLRACYQQGLAEKEPAAPNASATIQFSVDKGNPTWLKVTEASGLTKDVTRCLTDTVARWSGLFPAKGDYDESQRLKLTFESKAKAVATESAKTVSSTGQ